MLFYFGKFTINVRGTVAAPIFMGMLMLAAAGTLVFAQEYDSMITDFQTWGKDMSSERTELRNDMKKYRRLWKENREEIMQKHQEELKEFLSQNKT